MPTDERPPGDAAPGPAGQPVAWIGRTRTSRPWLLLVPLVLLAGVAAVGLLPSRRDRAPAPAPTSAVAETRPAATTDDLPQATPRVARDLSALAVRCMDVEPVPCRRVANAAASAVEGTALGATVWSSVICGMPWDCPHRLLDSPGAVGSVILRMPDNQRIVANVNSPASRTPGSDPIVVVLGWHPND